MRHFDHTHNKFHWLKWVLIIPIAVAAGVFLFGYVVMLLWNGILPEVFGLHTITFWQALGILVLSKILFGGFGHKGHRSHHNHQGPGWQRWYRQLTPEERDKMHTSWKQHCRTDANTAQES